MSRPARRSSIWPTRMKLPRRVLQRLVEDRHPAAADRGDRRDQRSGAVYPLRADRSRPQRRPRRARSEPLHRAGAGFARCLSRPDREAAHHQRNARRGGAAARLRRAGRAGTDDPPVIAGNQRRTQRAALRPARQRQDDAVDAHCRAVQEPGPYPLCRRGGRPDHQSVRRPNSPAAHGGDAGAGHRPAGAARGRCRTSAGSRARVRSSWRAAR